MFEWECPECGIDNYEDEFPYGNEIICEHCGECFETDWDEDWDGNRQCWIVN